MANQKIFPQSELCRRRGITLSPIITKFVHGPIREDFIESKNTAPRAGQGRGRTNSNVYHEDVSKWSSSTESSSSIESSSVYSQDEGNPEFDDQEPYEERLERHREFFNVRPLMRCLDTDEDKVLGELLFARLLMEVQEAFGAPAQDCPSGFRGELESRNFWDDVRMQLRVDDDVLEI